MSENILFMKAKRITVIIILVLVLLGGLAIRLIDVTDLPLDFAATRQLHSYIMARGLYYQMDTPVIQALPETIRSYGITVGQSEPTIEPPIMEYIVALTYAATGSENMIFARLFSILFWELGGLAMFLLCRRLMSLDGAIAATTFFLVVPFGVYSSRSFQPDPLMIMFIIFSWYFQVRWSQNRSLKNALLAGVFTGLTFLIKAPAVFFVGVSFVGIILSKEFKKWIKDPQVYIMAAISILPALIFNLVSATAGGNAGAIFGARFFPNLFIDPSWYFKWLAAIKGAVGYYPLFIALLGFFVIKKRENRFFYLSIWIGYVLYGFMFAYHIYTHNYYQLPLIAIVAIGMGYALDVAFEKLAELNKRWFPRLAIILVLLFSVGYCVVRIRSEVLTASYRHEAAYWTALGEKIGMGSKVIALTHDYGYRLSYWGFINAKLWDTAGDLTVKELEGATNPDFPQLFKEKAIDTGMEYFLVTLINDFNSQTDLHDYLFATYPYEEGEGYYLFDLRHPLTLTN